MRAWILLALLVLMMSLRSGLAAPAEDVLAAQRSAFLQALGMAERGPREAWKRIAIDLQDHPLFPYLEYASLDRHVARVSVDEVRDFLHRHAELPVADNLRVAMARRLAERGDWRGVKSLADGSRTPARRCLWLRARIETGGDEALRADLDALWVTPRSLPDACDPVLDYYARRGWRTADQVAARLQVAAEAGEAGLAAYLLRALDESDRAGGERLVQAARDAPAALRLAPRWPDDAWSRSAASLALRRLARSDPAQAESLLDALVTRLSLSESERGRVRHDIALFSALALDPKSAERVARVPELARSDDLREWAVRSAIGRAAWEEAQAALEGLPASLRESARWRYLEARILGKRGRQQEAERRLALLADEPHYYGFLAADRLGRPKALCPRAAPDSASARAVLSRAPGLLRALELHRLQRHAWARREWDRALAALSGEDRVAAARLAQAQDWHDRSVFALTDEAYLDYYELRFPVAHRRLIEERSAAHDLDPALVLAMIRAESAWLPDARSHANAHGLMQLLPSTAAALARVEGVSLRGPRDLHDPRLNIRLGTAHLRQMLARYDGSPWLAAAAYNAGPSPVARWLASERPADEPDLWIETISYRETREYVARILAFSLVYDWRLHGAVKPMSARMPPRGRPMSLEARRMDARCPQPSDLAAVAPDGR